jgi:hypothetical protein
MGDIYIAFFKAKYGQWDDKLIDKFSGNIGYSHCEFVVDENTTIGSHALAGGVTRFKYNNILADERWDVLRIYGTYVESLIYAEKHIGDPYDFLGVALHYIGIDIYESRKGQWCSEFCHNVVKAGKMMYSYKDPLPMPNELYKTLLENGAKPVPITYASTETKPEIDYLGHVAYGTK